MVAHGRVHIPTSGQWTFGTHSDDGFALRVRDGSGNLVAWDSFSGNGTLDLSGRKNLSHPAPTGDSNTRGVITLQGGQNYDLEYVAYEDGGGTFWELYSAKAPSKTTTRLNGYWWATTVTCQLMDRREA